MTIKFSKEVTEFIEANAANTDEGLPDRYYWFNQYYKKVSEGLFEVTQWKDLPNSLRHIVEQSEPRNPEEEAGDKKLFEKFVYADTSDILFGVWLGENGWQPYDGMDRWRNLKLNRTVESIRDLFSEYKKENPDP